MAYIGSGLTRFNTADDLTVTDDATIQDNATVGGNLSVTGTTTLTDDLNVDSGTLFVDASEGNVGIGTSSPRNVAGYATLALNASNGGLIDINDDDTRIATVGADGSGLAINAVANMPMIFSTNNAEAMRIDSSGHLAVGRTTPVSGLANFSQLTVSGAEGGITINSTDTTTGDYSRLMFTKSGSTGNEGLIRYNTGDYHMAFWTNASEAMRIDSSGRALIGRTTAAGATTNDGHNLYPTGEHFLFTSTTTLNNDVFRVYNYLGTITNSIDADGDVKNTNGSYGSLSDQSIKENIVDASSQWDDIKALQIRNYNLIDYPDRTHIGVIAQEVESAGMNGLVKEGEDGLKSVKYSILYMKAVKALQEAIARIETLEAQVATLQGN